MSYSAQESSVHGGSAVELYEFVSGTVTWRFTSRANDVVWGGHTWVATPIRRTEIEQNKEINKANVSIEFPLRNEFARQFLGYGADVVTTVTLRRGHDTDGSDEFIVYWRGRVSSGKPDGSTISIECESVFTSMRRPGLRARFQRSCRHVVYGRGCRLDKADWAVAGTASSVAGTAVSVVAAAGFDDGYFRGGMLLHDLTLRYVIDHAGAALTLTRPIASLTAAALSSGDLSVTIYPGCDGSIETCDGRFENLDNHGGFRWIPLKNPMGGGSIV